MKALLDYIDSLGTHQKATARIILGMAVVLVPFALLAVITKYLGAGGFWGAVIGLMAPAAFYIAGKFDKAEK